MTLRCQRRIEAAIALIVELWDGQNCYLLQWSRSWQGLYIVGGKREVGETFEECLIREILEELPIDRDEFAVHPDPLQYLEYEGFSQSQDVWTWYVIQVFNVVLRPNASTQKVNLQKENYWVQLGIADEITSVPNDNLSPRPGEFG